MLTADLVRVRRRAGTIYVSPLSKAQRERAVTAARAYVALAGDCVGRTRGELEEAWDSVPHAATDYKLVKGLRKLLRDRCDFVTPSELDPIVLRQKLFSRAAAVRASLAEGERFSRDDVLAEVAGQLDLEPGVVADGLFCDLKEHHRLEAVKLLSGEDLVANYELAQEQAVLLRALHVSIHLQASDPAAYREFFRKLKFRRLLYRLRPADEGGYQIDVDGPLSLFKAVTKYGLQLALLLPALRAAGRFRLTAQVRWDKDKEPLSFELEGEPSGTKAAEALVPDEVVRLRDGVERLGGAWHVELATEIVDLPGVGLCVPDLAFVHRDTGERVLLEVLGYWSRAAVWRRVELVEAGLRSPVVFALSSRLRVSEEVLPADLPGQLYVYKGVMSPKAVLERVERAAQAGR